ncbi:MAG: hypothetical protein WCK70_16485 [Chloroflexales bacterium]
MDWMLITGIVAVGLLLAVIVLVMLNRAWGNFPGPISGIPSDQPLPSRAAAPSAPLDNALEEMTPNGGMVPVNHPLLRRAVMAALERGGSPYALYFIRDGEAVYLIPSRIADPQQREQLTRLFTAMDSTSNGEGLPSLGEAIRMIQEMGKK